MKKQTNEQSNYRKPSHLNLSPAGRSVRWVKTSSVLNISNANFEKKRHFQYDCIRDLRFIISQSKYIRLQHISLSLSYFLSDRNYQGRKKIGISAYVSVFP